MKYLWRINVTLKDSVFFKSAPKDPSLLRKTELDIPGDLQCNSIPLIFNFFDN